MSTEKLKTWMDELAADPLRMTPENRSAMDRELGAAEARKRRLAAIAERNYTLAPRTKWHG